MTVTNRGDATYRVFNDYDKQSIATTAEELTVLFDYLLANIGTLQLEAIEAKRAQLPQVQKAKVR
ncbi:MAG: hypothetical protein ACJ8BW_18770 [Ktedonobacteraceae bacterium]